MILLPLMEKVILVTGFLARLGLEEQLRMAVPSMKAMNKRANIFSLLFFAKSMEYRCKI